MIYLSLFVFLAEIFRICFLIVGYILCFKFLSAYINTKSQPKVKTEFLYVGLSWLFITTMYICGTISFLWIVFLGIPFNNLYVFVFFNVILAPWVAFWWFSAMLHLFFKKYKKKVLIFCGIIFGFFEIIVIYYLIVDPLALGSIQSYFEYDYALFLKIFVGICLGLTLVSGFIFAIKVWKNPDPVVKLKGRFLFIAFIIFFLSSILDAVVSVIDPFYAMLAKILLILCVINFYIGFFLPHWIRKLFPSLSSINSKEVETIK